MCRLGMRPYHLWYSTLDKEYDTLWLVSHGWYPMAAILLLMTQLVKYGDIIIIATVGAYAERGVHSSLG